MTATAATATVEGEATTGHPAHLDEIARAARTAFATTVLSTSVDRAGWLTAVADALDDAAHELIPLADEESHLGTPRLTGELARTTAQLRLFAEAIVEGSYVEATIDHPNPRPRRPDPTCDGCSDRSDPWPCSAPRTSRSRSRSPAAIPPRRSRPDAPSS